MAAASDFESLARQYWSAWGEALRAGAPAAPSGIPDWKDAVDWWSRLAHGGPLGGELEYVDRGTVSHAFGARSEMP